ncbi:MAG: ABC transporter substrate-binding protein [Proteobacteria bacterium]|nr:ABC transporter substrate-binding protein [Pseudomonadota bacterium]
MQKIVIRPAIAGALGIAVLATPAFAQKSKDTLRVAYSDPISMVDLIFDPKPETALTARMVHDGLLHYDEKTSQFKPLLAKSWRQTNPTTIEFDLRDDVTYHNGSKFDADDVTYTVNWLIDPKTRVRFKTNYTWIARVEKLGQYKVRIIAKRPSPIAMLRLAYSVPIYPSDVHGTLKVKSDFGRNPVGTGPYRVVSIDPNKGLVMEKNAGYKHGGTWKKASVGRLHALPMPDKQTQTAQLITGGVDVIKDLSRDQTLSLQENPNFAVTASQGLLYSYISLDASGRSGFKILGNKKVRRAIMMAVDREGISKNLIAGGSEAKPMDSLCFRNQFGCDFGSKPVNFDPAGAKKLMAEAGVTDIEIPIYALTQRSGAVAEAVSGNLRKIGIRSKINVLTFGAYRKTQAQGKFGILVSLWSSGGLPDVASTMNLFFSQNARDYWRDDILTQARNAGGSILDNDKRKAIYRKAFDRVNSEHYIMPISTLPTVFVHSKDVRVDKGSFSPYGAILSDFHWN